MHVKLTSFIPMEKASFFGGGGEFNYCKGDIGTYIYTILAKVAGLGKTSAIQYNIRTFQTVNTLPTFSFSIMWSKDVGQHCIYAAIRRGYIQWVIWRIFQIFGLKRFYLWNHSSYRLGTWYEYSHIILLYLQGIPCQSHFQYGRGEHTRVDRVQKSLFYASLWRLTIQDRRLAVASNIGSVK